MNPITSTAKVMQNFTICISQPIREQMSLKAGDQVILNMDTNGQVTLVKGVNDLEGINGMAKATFKALGGGEHFLKQERKAWEK